MRVARRLAITALVVILGLLTLGNGSAFAATPLQYVQQVANALHSNPVYVDPHAAPTISAGQATQLDDQIRTTEKPIFVVLIDNSEARNFSSPNEFLADLHNDMGTKSSQVIAVSTSKSFYANGYNLPTAVMNNAGPLAQQTVDQAKANGNTPNPYSVYSQWVSSVASIVVPQNSNGSSASRSTGSATSSTNNSGFPVWAIVLIVLAALAVVTIIIVMFMKNRRRKQEELRRRQTTKQDNMTSERREQRQLSELNVALAKLQPQVTLHPDAQSDYEQALVFVDSATAALNDGDIVEAERKLNLAEESVRRARLLINGIDPDARPASAPSSSSYSTGRTRYVTDNSGTSTQTTSQSSGNRGARVRRPGGGTTIINNTTYTPNMGGYSAAYPHYYPGGMYGGVMYGAGYYADPFWTWEVLATDLAIDEQLAYDRDQFNGGTYNTTGTTGGGNWNTPDDGNTGFGGDGNTSYDDGSNVDSGSGGGGSWQGPDSGDTGFGENSNTSYDTSGDGGGSTWDDSNTDFGNSDTGSSGDDSGGWGGDSGGGSDFGGGSSDSGGGW